LTLGWIYENIRDREVDFDYYDTQEVFYSNEAPYSGGISHLSAKPKEYIENVNIPRIESNCFANSSDIFMYNKVNFEKIAFVNCWEIEANGIKYSLGEFEEKLRNVNRDWSFRVILYNQGGLRNEYNLNIRMPSQKEIDIIAFTFQERVKAFGLTTEAVSQFLKDCEHFKGSSEDFVLALKNYCLGVIGKEKDLVKSDYLNKFQQAYEHIKHYGTIQAAALRGILKLNYNEFMPISGTRSIIFPDLEVAHNLLKSRGKHTLNVNEFDCLNMKVVFPVDTATYDIIEISKRLNAGQEVTFSTRKYHPYDEEKISILKEIARHGN